MEKKSIRSRIIGQSHDFDEHSLFVSLIASFAPKRSEGANDAKGDTNKLYVQQKLFDYIIIINTQGQIVQNLFRKERLLT